MFHNDRHARAIYSLVDTDIIMWINENIPRDVLCRFFFIKYIVKNNGEIFNGRLARGEVVRYLINVSFNLRADILVRRCNLSSDTDLLSMSLIVNNLFFPAIHENSKGGEKLFR